MTGRNVVRAAVGGLLVLILGACGAGAGTTVGAVTPTTASGTASGLQKVSFGGAVVEVPAGWPVYDLTAAPHRCARFDMHAVYLGHQASDATCPARALGKSEAVQIEAYDQVSQAQVRPSPATTTVNGQAVAIEPGGPANYRLVATFPGLGVVVRVTYGSDSGLAQQIVNSVMKAGS